MELKLICVKLATALKSVPVRGIEMNWIDILDLISQALLAVLVFIRTRNKF